MNNIIRNKSVNLPKLDKIKTEIRDKIFASEKELNDFIEQLNYEINTSVNEIENKKTHIGDLQKNLEEETQYYTSRNEELKSQLIPDLQSKIDSKGDEYAYLAEKYKETIQKEFKNIAKTISYDEAIFNKAKNKIEAYKAVNDLDKPTRRLKKNENADQDQEYSRFNIDDYASTMFYHKTFIPFDDVGHEVEICTIQPLPAYYRDKSIENHELGAMYVKIIIRGSDLVADINMYTCKLNAKKYGVALYSEGVINNGEDLEVRVYMDKDKILHVCLVNPYYPTETESELKTKNLIVNIGITSLLSGGIETPAWVYHNIDSSTMTLVGKGQLTHKYGAYYGPLEMDTNDMGYITAELNGSSKYFLSADERFGNTSLYRINTIEEDIEQIKTNPDILINRSHIQYKKSDNSTLVKDEIAELLIRSLLKLELVPNVVYKCFGWVMIDYMYFPITQIKLTSQIRDPEGIFDTTEKMAGVEMQFDAHWEYARDDCDDPFIEDSFLQAFPGIAIEGGKTFINYTGKTETTNDTPTRSCSYGSIRASHRANNVDAKFSDTKLWTEINPGYNFAWYNAKQATVLLCGYDLTIFIPEDYKDRGVSDLSSINYKVKD